MNEPYAPPGSAIDARPSAIGWFRGYCVVSAVFYLVATLFAFLAHGPIALTLVLLAIALFYGGATMIPYTPRGWSIGLVAIALGMSSITILVAIPLLVQWNKPILKAAFRRLP